MKPCLCPPIQAASALNRKPGAHLSDECDLSMTKRYCRPLRSSPQLIKNSPHPKSVSPVDDPRASESQSRFLFEQNHHVSRAQHLLLMVIVQPPAVAIRQCNLVFPLGHIQVESCLETLE